MPVDFSATISTVLGSPPIESQELSGGQIGTVYRATLADDRRIVVKTGETRLDIEGDMLQYLADQSKLPVPRIYHSESDLLLIEYIEGGTNHGPAVAKDAADHLAALHENQASEFGFEWETTTGPVRQPNPWTDAWIDFYRDHRLGYLVSEGEFSAEARDRINAVRSDLDELLTEPEFPSLIHGDVWTTNVLAHNGHIRAFLDPAIYYAHPEIELAYIDWTSTFGTEFFTRYREHREITDGFFERRRFVYRLYPLLIHVELFGGRYHDALSRTLNRLGY